jgi:uncharacterized protein (TIGR03437 family)
MFSVFRRPSARNVPGVIAGQRRVQDWQFWRAGGTATGGVRAFGMQDLVDAIRGAGAQQPIALPAYHDALGFRGFTADLAPRGENLVYELHPSFEFGLTDAERDAQYGSLSTQFAFYAGEWGLTLRESTPACTMLPLDPVRVTDLMYQAFTYFDRKATSWTVTAFEPGSLIRDFAQYQPTMLDRAWTCGQSVNPQPGMGELLALWTTGDPTGFGVLRAEQIASSAGGPAGPIAPGQLLSLYTEQLGPLPGVAASLDASGRLPTNLAGTQVTFDGVPAPVLYAGSSQINVQVPHSLAGKARTAVRVTYGRVPSNEAMLDVVEAAPELFQDGARSAIVVNEEGTLNRLGAPARGGSIVVLYGTGFGPTTPVGVTGAAAGLPHPVLALPISVTVDRQPAEVLFAGETPGFVGLVQINVRLAGADAPGTTPRLVPITVDVGGRINKGSVFLWLRSNVIP